jgi:hypothetical protein
MTNRFPAEHCTASYKPVAPANPFGLRPGGMVRDKPVYHRHFRSFCIIIRPAAELSPAMDGALDRTPSFRQHDRPNLRPSTSQSIIRKRVRRPTFQVRRRLSCQFEQRKSPVCDVRQCMGALETDGECGFWMGTASGG